MLEFKLPGRCVEASLKLNSTGVWSTPTKTFVNEDINLRSNMTYMVVGLFFFICLFLLFFCGKLFNIFVSFCFKLFLFFLPHWQIFVLVLNNHLVFTNKT